jgi:predicted SAM-dependent methyltransferase
VHDVKVKRNDFINRFDTIYASSVLDMFSHKDTAHILGLFFQYLRPSGRFVMVSWDDNRLTAEKLAERNQYNWYWRDGLGLDEIADVLQKIGFKILKKDIHNVANPIEYEWGIIFSVVAQK